MRISTNIYENYYNHRLTYIIFAAKCERMSLDIVVGYNLSYEDTMGVSWISLNFIKVPSYVLIKKNKIKRSHHVHLSSWVWIGQRRLSQKEDNLIYGKKKKTIWLSTPILFFFLIYIYIYICKVDEEIPRSELNSICDPLFALLV